MKTRAELILCQSGISYQLLEYPANPDWSAYQIAVYTKKKPEDVYKTLVCRGSGHHTYVCVLPSTNELDFEKVCRITGEKRMRLAPRNVLHDITGGYVKGCCTPIGMKCNYPVIIDLSAKDKTKIYLNGGRIGILMEIRPSDLRNITNGSYERIVMEKE